MNMNETLKFYSGIAFIDPWFIFYSRVEFIGDSEKMTKGKMLFLKKDILIQKDMRISNRYTFLNSPSFLLSWENSQEDQLSDGGLSLSGYSFLKKVKFL